jgi:hypothetical protein
MLVAVAALPLSKYASDHHPHILSISDEWHLTIAIRSFIMRKLLPTSKSNTALHLHDIHIRPLTPSEKSLGCGRA